MSYNGSIPQLTDARAQSQSQLLANFQAINTVWANNHFNLTESNLFQGMHNVLTMRPQGSDPNTDATQVSLYNKLVSGNPQLFFKPNSNQSPIQLTLSTVKSDSTGTQYTYIAGPFLVHHGFIDIPLGIPNNTVVNLPIGTNILYVGLSSALVTGIPFQIKNAIATNVNSPANSFTISFQTGVSMKVVYYMAIGV